MNATLTKIHLLGYDISMKFLVVAVLLAVIQTSPPVPRKAPNSGTCTSQSIQSHTDDKKTPTTTPTPSSEPTATSQADKKRSDVGATNTDHTVIIREAIPVSVIKDWADYLAIFSSFLLFIIVAVGVCFAVKTLNAINDQAAAMKDQLTAMQAAGAQTDRQIALAEQNIKIIVSKERARLRIEVDDLMLPKGVNPFSLISVKYRVRLYGPTAAIIVNTISDAIVSESQEPPNELLMSGLSIPAIISPSDPPAEGHQLIMPSPDLEKDILSIKRDKKFVHFWGVIHYQDVFEKHYWLRFRYAWKFTSFVSLGKDGDRIGRWHENGPPEDNSETQNPN